MIMWNNYNTAIKKCQWIYCYYRKDNIRTITLHCNIRTLNYSNNPLESLQGFCTEQWLKAETTCKFLMIKRWTDNKPLGIAAKRCGIKCANLSLVHSSFCLSVFQREWLKYRMSEVISFHPFHNAFHHSSLVSAFSCSGSRWVWSI